MKYLPFDPAPSGAWRVSVSEPSPRIAQHSLLIEQKQKPQITGNGVWGFLFGCGRGSHGGFLKPIFICQLCRCLRLLETRIAGLTETGRACGGIPLRIDSAQITLRFWVGDCTIQSLPPRGPNQRVVSSNQSASTKQIPLLLISVDRGARRRESARRRLVCGSGTGFAVCRSLPHRYGGAPSRTRSNLSGFAKRNCGNAGRKGEFEWRKAEGWRVLMKAFLSP